ncbi:MAG: 5-oxoprolinase subunit PxpB [Planctomycetota bacterium]
MSRRLLRVLRAGLMTTVQDTGRADCGHMGVPVGGSLDRLSHRLANRLVGNPETAAVLELTLRGDDIEFLDDAVIAICGADLRPQLETEPGCLRSCPVQCPVFIKRGTVLRLGLAVRGCRAVLAVAGGIEVPQLLGSRSTLLRSGWGGFGGRRLAAGDCLAVGEAVAAAGVCGIPVAVGEGFPRWGIRLQPLPGKEPARLRFVAGTHFGQLTCDSRAQLLEGRFELRPESDRMGYRLRGPVLELASAEQGRLKSAGVVPGTLQLPADGQLLLLMADCAPTGGYPRIGHVISADLSLAAQLRPGDSLRLEQVTTAEALRAFEQQERELRAALVMAGL